MFRCTCTGSPCCRNRDRHLLADTRASALARLLSEGTRRRCWKSWSSTCIPRRESTDPTLAQLKTCDRRKIKKYHSYFVIVNSLSGMPQLSVSVSVLRPSHRQSSPSQSGQSGSGRQVRLRVRTPSPHVMLHSPNGDHSDHMGGSNCTIHVPDIPKIPSNKWLKIFLF